MEPLSKRISDVFSKYTGLKKYLKDDEQRMQSLKTHLIKYALKVPKEIADTLSEDDICSIIANAWLDPIIQKLSPVDDEKVQKFLEFIRKSAKYLLQADVVITVKSPKSYDLLFDIDHDIRYLEVVVRDSKLYSAERMSEVISKCPKKIPEVPTTFRKDLLKSFVNLFYGYMTSMTFVEQPLVYTLFCNIDHELAKLNVSSSSFYDDMQTHCDTLLFYLQENDELEPWQRTIMKIINLIKKAIRMSYPQREQLKIILLQTVTLWYLSEKEHKHIPEVDSFEDFFKQNQETFLSLDELLAMMKTITTPMILRRKTPSPSSSSKPSLSAHDQRLERQRLEWEHRFFQLLREFQQQPLPKKKHSRPSKRSHEKPSSGVAQAAYGGAQAQTIPRQAKPSSRAKQQLSRHGGGQIKTSAHLTPYRPQGQTISPFHYYEHKHSDSDPQSDKLRQRKQHNYPRFYQELPGILEHIVSIARKYQIVILVDHQNMSNVYTRRNGHESTFEQRQRFLLDPTYRSFLSQEYISKLHDLEHLKVLWIMVTQGSIEDGKLIHMSEPAVREKNLKIIIVRVACEANGIDCFKNDFTKNPMDDLFLLTLQKHLEREQLNTMTALHQEKRHTIQQLRRSIDDLRSIEEEDDDQTDHYINYLEVTKKLEDTIHKVLTTKFPRKVRVSTDKFRDAKLRKN